MLADSVSGARSISLLNNDDWWAEQKLDGHRVLMIIENGVAYPYNRKGEPFKGVMNDRIRRDFAHPRWAGEWILDGEALDDQYHVFDIVMIAGNSVTNVAYEQRRGYLDQIFAAWNPQWTHLVRTHKTTEEKTLLSDRVSATGGEGLMFKRKNLLYLPGKRSSSMLKWKFVKTCDAFVTEVGREGKSSIALGLYDNGKIVDVGACTMSDGNLAKIRVGDVCEIRYLYCGAGGRLYQPAFIRTRTDKDMIDCGTDQLSHVNKAVVST